MDWSLERALEHYKSLGAPGDQIALTALLREIQRESGGSIPRPALRAAADAYGLKESFLLAIIRRIPSLRLVDTHCLELCAGPNCGKHAGLAAYAEGLQKSSGGCFTLKFVPCMRQCGKGPNVKWDGTVYNRADEALLRKLVKDSMV